MKIAFILAGFFLLLLLLEALFPLRHRTWALVRRLIVNRCEAALAWERAPPKDASPKAYKALFILAKKCR
jgi:hypothetical protein